MRNQEGYEFLREASRLKAAMRNRDPEPATFPRLIAVKTLSCTSKKAYSAVITEPIDQPPKVSNESERAWLLSFQAFMICGRYSSTAIKPFKA